MADDGHRTDGSDDGTSINRGAEAAPASPTRPSGESPGLAKILPFPRDWFGPVDDLVPVFPEPASGPAAISAASFWDEDAGAVHQVVESLDRRWVGDGADEGLQSLESDAEDQDQAVVAEPRGRVRRVRVFAIAGGVFCLLLVCAAVVFVLLTGGLRHSLSLFSTTPAASHTTRAESAATSTPSQTVRVVVRAKKVVSRRRHGSRTVAGRSSDKTSPDRTSHESSPAATSVQPDHSAAPTPSTADTAGSSGSAGAGCVQSPDSGCMP